jgi:UDP-3-O-[3-hydroxymyristoyl] glucosamine N-acyltransferase
MEVSLKELSKVLGAIEFTGDGNQVISELIDLLSQQPTSNSQLFWCNTKNVSLLENLLFGTVIVSAETKDNIRNPKLNIIVTKQPRSSFKMVLEKYFLKPTKYGYISKTATISSEAAIGVEVHIGENVVIESGCKIGEKVIIGSNTVILSGTIINNSVTIGCNNTIGGIGFGYEKDEDGEWEVIPHIGNVVIHEFVEIGNNTCIDRAVLGSTVIGKNVKIDNLVHIAHGVKIHENSLIIANAMVAGNAIIESNVWIGPSVSIINKGIVKKDSLVGMSAVVIKPVEENSVVAGNPAKFFRHNIEK